MSTAIDETIKEIAVKHGVSLGRDDPILILQTMNEHLLCQHKEEQKALLSSFKDEIEKISQTWQDDTKEKAEKILNAALNASQGAMETVLKKTSIEHSDLIKQEIHLALREVKTLNAETKKVSRVNLIYCSLMLAATFFMALFSYLLK
jgi:L-lactate utilization protein LutC